MVEKKNAHQIVLNARSDQKITTQTLIKNLFSEFFELHGDRVSGDDPAIITGVAYFLGQPVTVIATDKGISPAEKKARHFGSPTPAGYRKVLRVAKQAEKFKRPVLFPKIVFLYDKNLHGDGSEEYPSADVFNAGIACSSKTMYPDWLSLTGNGYVPEMYKKYGRVVSPMGKCKSAHVKRYLTVA